MLITQLDLEVGGSCFVENSESGLVEGRDVACMICDNFLTTQWICFILWCVLLSSRMCVVVKAVCSIYMYISVFIEQSR